MNLRNVRFWKTPKVTPIRGDPQSLRDDSTDGISLGMPPEAAGNVVPLPIHRDSEGPSPGLSDERFVPVTLPSPLGRFIGLMNSPELTGFFDENYFGLGRHNGAHYRTQEALELGKNSLISKFQNTITDLIERNQTKANKLQNELIAIEGISPSMSAQLRLACEHVRRDISVLQGQIDSAREGKGWILEALNRYQIGFTKGLREAIAFELLSR